MSAGFFHRHVWTEVERVFTGTVPVSKMDNATRETAERLLFGVTTIVQRCSVCGALSTTEVKGDATPRNWMRRST